MDQLKREITGLMNYIRRVRQEIAAIDRPEDEANQFNSMGEQLDAIVQATEKATSDIMQAMDDNEAVVGKLREALDDPDQVALLDQITANGNAVFEACSFQDITGQRVNKVIKSVTYVEQRIQAIIDVWGKDILDDIVVSVDGQEKSEDEKLISGPLLNGDGLSQDDIDALFD